MRKIFLIPLFALMCSVTAWARQITLGGTGADYSSLANLKTAIDNGSLQLSASDSIMLGANQTFAKNGVYDFKNATIIFGKDIRFTHSTGGGEITIKNVMLKDATNSGGAVNIQTSSATTVNFVNVKSDHNGATIGITKTQPSTAPTINIDENCVIAGNIWSNGSYSIQLYGSANINNRGQLTKYVAVHRHSDAQYEDAVVNINNEGTIDQGILADANQTVNIVNSGTLTQAVGNNGIFNLTNNGVATIYGDPTILSGGKNAQYNGTISFAGSVNADIIKNGEPNTVFNVVPSGSKATIHRYCYFPAGIGDLAIEDGYYWRSSDGKIMEADGLVASVFHVSTSTTETFEELSAAFAAALTGDKITLEKDLNTSDPIWIGTISVDGTPRDLILDLNGHTIRSASHVIETLILSHGSLNIINSVPGEGGIYNEATKGVAVQVHGSYLQNCNPRTQTPFTHLTISEGVDISATGVDGSGVAVYELDINERAYSQFGVDYLTNIYREWAKKSGGWKHTEQGVANGVRVDINGHITAKKYGFKVNGNIDFPDVTKYGTGTKVEASRDSVAYWNGYVVSVGDTAYCPYIHIGSTALLEGDNSEATSAALYASGYARYDIEGTLKGASGLYVRGGKVTVKNDANIQSTFEGSASFTPGSSTSGIDTKGNAIVLNPKSGYPGHIEFIVEGDAKMSTKATGGAALLEDVATPDMLESIAINGGQFTGPYALAICEATQASGAVVVYGTTLTSEYVADVSGIMASGVHKVVIPNNDGTTTVIVSKGEVPTSITEFGDTSAPKAGEIVSLLPGSDVNWTGTNAGVIGDGSNSTILSLGELQIISGTEENKQLLTIKEKATLEVDRLIMSENARIVVKEGAKLIVKGTQGINAPSTENILLESSEDKQCIFLFHPEVTSNRHPSATYKFASKARYANGICTWQRFGAPTYNGATTMTWEGDVKTALYKYDYSVDNWVQFPMSQDNIYEIEGRPFACYNMTINENPAEDVVYTFTGELMGNNDAPLKFVRGWNSFANSYAAPIDVKSLVQEIFDEFESGVDATVYIYNRNADGTTGWISINGADLLFSDDEPVINSMQAFILHANNQAEGAVSYERNVYEPIIPSNANQAPARRMRDANAYNGVSLTFTDGVQSEVVKLLEGEEFSDEFDNMYDAVKLENDNNFSAYCIIGEEKYSTVATNDLTDKAIVFDNKVAGTFTLNVNSAVGELLKLYDAVAKQLVNLEKGTSYEFEAEAVNDPQRFIVKPSDIPSSIDETEIVLKASKFVGADGQIYILRGGNVYSIQGQQIH